MRQFREKVQIILFSAYLFAKQIKEIFCETNFAFLSTNGMQKMRNFYETIFLFLWKPY